MFRHCATVLLIAAGSFATLDAQKGKQPPGMPAGMPDPAQMQATMNAAQKNAKRPGDEAMTCDALQNELVSTMQDPKVKAVIGSQGAYAQEQQKKLEAGMAGANGPSKGSIAAQMARGFATSMIPGAGMTQVAAQNAQIQSQMAQAAQNQADMFQHMGEMMSIMPQMMRGQRLVELAQAKKCDWMQDPGQGK